MRKDGALDHDMCVHVCVYVNVRMFVCVCADVSVCVCALVLHSVRKVAMKLLSCVDAEDKVLLPQKS